MLRRHLEQEARGLAEAVAVHPAMEGVGDPEPRLRARDPDVAEPPLFLELVHRVHRADVREDPLLHAREKDDGELEPLRRVEGHEGDAARALR